MAVEKESKFLNPFESGITYDKFLSELEKSKKTIDEYCNKKITAEELTWLKSELEHYTNNQKN